ncbi:cytochrome P450 [Aspergillus alliaceus]|uniref:cytochrome P450 n=1 Tax=Petromyces alliaceus TaxID=209559 RepID=UPI0012A66449|nr:cytochrome P450 [Aspergillus alliaceus]KAB8232864.1 cytochrome P450 [Aspergillus alliaceus]
MFLLYAVIVFFILGRVCYRLYFHPLRSFPGLKLAAITTLYEFYFAVIKDGQVFWELDELYIRDTSFYNEIYANDARVTEKAAPFIRSFSVPGSMVATVGHNHHKKIETLMQHFKKAHREQSIISLFVAFSALTGDIISYYAYGTDYCFLKDINNSNAVKAAAESFGSFSQGLRSIPFDLPRIRRIPSNVMEKVFSTSSQNDQVARDDRGTTKSLPNTVFKSLIDPSLPPLERTLDRLQDEGFVLLGAGTETISWALSVTVFYLLRNNILVSRLHEDLKTVMPEQRDVPRLFELETLPLLRAVVNEGLRLSFGVLTHLPRVVPLDPLNYKGQIIPAGITVSQSIYFIHMEPQYFPDPRTFNPGRWLGPAERRALESMIVLFSRGSRQCLGMKYVLPFA